MLRCGLRRREDMAHTFTTSAQTSVCTSRGCAMPYTVDFNTVSTVGLESSPVTAALAGLRANEARYFKNKWASARNGIKWPKRPY